MGLSKLFIPHFQRPNYPSSLNHIKSLVELLVLRFFSILHFSPSRLCHHPAVGGSTGRLVGCQVDSGCGPQLLVPGDRTDAPGGCKWCGAVAGNALGVGLGRRPGGLGGLEGSVGCHFC